MKDDNLQDYLDLTPSSMTADNKERATAQL